MTVNITLDEEDIKKIIKEHFQKNNCLYIDERKIEFTDHYGEKLKLDGLNIRISQ